MKLITSIRVARVFNLCLRQNTLAALPGVAALAAVVVIGSGCSAWVPGVQVRWYTPPHSGPVEAQLSNADSWVRVKTANFTPETAGRLTYEGGESVLEHKIDWTQGGEQEGNYTVFDLHPGEYEFEYLVPHSQEMIYGEMKIYGPGSMRARDFIHRTFVLIDPTSGAGGGQPSILNEDDLRRAAAGDLVTKVIFVANMKAIDGRIAQIDRDLRQLQDEEARLAGQEEYWSVKVAQRRRNALYFGDYGEDIPAIHLAMAQTLIGPEAYHWKRFSEADDRMRTYQEKRAQLRLPVERLREERGALRALLGSMKVIHREGNMVIASPDMLRRYHDAVDEITESRRTLAGPTPGVEAPYWFSEVAHTVHWPHLFSVIGIYPRLIVTNNRTHDHHEPIGELLLVMKIGARKPYRMN